MEQKQRKLTDTEIYNCVKANVALDPENPNARSFRTHNKYEHEFMAYALMAHFLFRNGYIYSEVAAELSVSDYTLNNILSWMKKQGPSSRLQTKVTLIRTCMDQRFGFHI